MQDLQNNQQQTHTNNKVQLKNVRLSYVTLFEPRAIMPGEKQYYSVSVIIKKNDPQLQEVVAKIKAIVAEQSWGGATFDNGVRDGDTERAGDEAYRGCYYMNVKSLRRPLVVDRRRNPITDPEVLVSGDYGNVSVSLYPYNKAGNKGIGWGLVGVQKSRDGEPLGNVYRAEDVFDDLGEEQVVSEFVNSIFE